MSIEKVWYSPVQKGHNFILFNEQIFYKRKVKLENVGRVKQELSQGKIDDQFFGLPIGYLRRVEYRDDDPELKISYGQDSEDTFDIPNQALRKEVFDYVKNNTTVEQTIVKKPSVLSRIKKPLIALFVVLGLFAFIYSWILDLNAGYVYELVPGRRGPGLVGISLALAQLGLVKNILIFSPLALIALYRIKINLDNDSEIHSLIYRT